MNQPTRSRLSRPNNFCKRGVFHVVAAFLFAASVSAQAPPSNPIAASRLPSGTQAIPEPIWAAAGATIVHRTTRCGSVIAAGSSISTVNTAITNCPAGQYVELASGSFTFSDAIRLKSNVTLRGAGPNATFITMTGSNCPYSSSVCFGGSFSNFMNNPDNTSSWTAGYVKSTSVIRLSSAASLYTGAVIHLDETNTGLPDPYPATWYCLVEPTCVVPSAAGGGDGGGTRIGRLHNQEAVVVSTSLVSGTTYDVTISPPLIADFSSGRTPQATWPSSTGSGAGIEELSIDNNNTSTFTFQMLNTTGSWIKHVRSINPGRAHALIQYAVRNTIQDSYFFRTFDHAATSYGIEWESGGSNLIVNNIVHWVTAPLIINSGVGNVIAYNFAINDEYASAPTVMFAGGWNHNGGGDFNLLEGNDMPGHNADIEHGQSLFTTLFRNYLWGREKSQTGATNSITISPLDRFYNALGNVMGVTGYHTQYQCTTSACPNLDLAIYFLGIANPVGPADDPHVAESLFRWGNWDTVTSTADNTSGDQTGTRWNSTEVPSAIGGSFANPVPSSHTLPNSMYLSAKPSFMKSSDPWPFYGPDVTLASPISNTGGHAAHNPAAQCYYNIMGGTNTGTTVLPFTCTYPLAGAPAAPTNLRIIRGF